MREEMVKVTDDPFEVPEKFRQQSMSAAALLAMADIGAGIVKPGGKKGVAAPPSKGKSKQSKGRKQMAKASRKKNRQRR